MSVERIHRYPEFFPLAFHDVDGIVQERVSDIRCRIAHKDMRVRLAPHQDRQRPDVIKMRMGNKNGVEFAVGDWLEVRKRFFAFQFRMHPAIEHNSLARRFEIITIGANFDAPRQVNEFQNSRFFRLPLPLPLCLTG